ncbi:hypothetical protein [Bordetella petrii]|uniref:hypothetical protein n=1 Tax=Bordetella petrii TaxID=94624 RepID=UPI001A96A0DE|nr:hypothetical protein [Bordetella petrii]MBO1111811.1 hypothetical protein [Bordetella petrii]
MGTPYAVLPGSDAAAAAAEAAAKQYTLDGFGESLSQILAEHGVDPVTSAAVSAAGEQLAQRPGGTPMAEEELPGLAESLVGAAVADPRVAGGQARTAVEENAAGLSKSEQEALAITAAGDAAEDAGADRATAEQKAREAIAAGVPPAAAAEAGAASAAAIAVTSNPDASPGIEIFGYLKARVQGLVTETYLADENKKVTGLTQWKIEKGPFFQTTAGELHINCKNYLAQADIDHVDTAQSNTKYLAGYETTAPSPSFSNNMGFFGATAVNAAYWVRTSSAAAYKRTVFGLDFYIALLGTQNTSSNNWIVDKFIMRHIVSIHARFYSNYR